MSLSISIGRRCKKESIDRASESNIKKINKKRQRIKNAIKKDLIMPQDNGTTNPKLEQRRAWLEKTVGALEAAIEAFLTENIDQYEISGDSGKRVVKRTALKELTETRDKYLAELDSVEDAITGVKRGKARMVRTVIKGVR
jgi:predicted metal-dependent hydrolase